MTLRPPAWLQNGEAYSASTDRMSVFDLSFEGHGVADPAHMRVTASSPASMVLRISDGHALVRSSVAGQGMYSVANVGGATVTVPTANSTNPRIDLVVLTIRDSDISGTADEAVFQVISGTPGTTPSAPSLPANSIELARVNVNKGVGALNANDIVDTHRHRAILRRTLGAGVHIANAKTKTDLARVYKASISQHSPLVVFDTSAPLGRELQYTINGNAWIPVNEAPNPNDVQMLAAGPSLVGGSTGNADGFTIQAGTTAHKSSASGDARVTLPRAFPNGLLTVVLTNGHHEVTGTLIYDLLPPHPTKGHTYKYEKNAFVYRIHDNNGNVKKNFQHRVNWIAVGW